MSYKIVECLHCGLFRNILKYELCNDCDTFSYSQPNNYDHGDEEFI